MLVHIYILCVQFFFFNLPEWWREIIERFGRAGVWKLCGSENNDTRRFVHESVYNARVNVRAYAVNRIIFVRRTRLRKYR